MSSSNDDVLARKQPCLLDPSSSQPTTNPSTWTRLLRICSSTSSMPPFRFPPQADPEPDNLLDPLDDIPLSSNLDQHSTSSAIPLSHSVSSSTSTGHPLKDAHCASSESVISIRPSESRPLLEPGQMTAQRIQRLRARTAAVIMSLPATFEEVVDIDEDEPCKAAEAPPVAQRPKLRRVSGIRDLRRAFCDADHGPVHFASISSFGVSKASYELGFLTSPTQPPSHLSSRSSSRTLVDSLNARPQSPVDQKTLCESTISSTSIASRFATKLYPTLSPRRPSHMRSPSDTSQSLFTRKHLAHTNSLTLTPQPHRHTSLQLDIPPLSPPGEIFWSCAKISRSAVKRAARRGQTPRRVFSHPIAVLVPG